MMHVCGNCGDPFPCNGGRGTDCSCGEVLVPRIRRKCVLCRSVVDPVQNAYVEEVRRVADNLGIYNIREGELCRCNKCEPLLGRVRFVV